MLNYNVDRYVRMSNYFYKMYIEHNIFFNVDNYFVD